MKDRNETERPTERTWSTAEERLWNAMCEVWDKSDKNKSDKKEESKDED